MALSLNGFGGAEESARPSLTDEQKEEFLRQAKVVSEKPINTGVTGTTRLTLTGDNLTHDAHLQCIDVRKTRFETPRGVEINFRDCYKLNIAACGLDRLIGQNLAQVEAALGEWPTRSEI